VFLSLLEIIAEFLFTFFYSIILITTLILKTVIRKLNIRLEFILNCRKNALSLKLFIYIILLYRLKKRYVLIFSKREIHF
jgi:hypothetical protein